MKIRWFRHPDPSTSVSQRCERLCGRIWRSDRVSLFDTQLGENLRKALDERLDDAISEAVQEVLDAVWSNDLDENQIQEAVEELENHVEFTHALLIGDAATACGLATFETRRRYCQTLIEAGALHASEQELMRLIEDDEISKKEKGEALGLLGRVHKQRFVRSGEAADIARAIRVPTNPRTKSAPTLPGTGSTSWGH